MSDRLQLNAGRDSCMLCGVCWEVPSSGVPHAMGGEGGGDKKEKKYFLDFQNDESPNASNGLSQVLVVHNQLCSLFKHPLTAEPDAQDRDAVQSSPHFPQSVC